MPEIRRKPMLLRSLKVKNFRSIADQEFEFESLGVLIGKNNTGKSNIMAAVRLLLEAAPRDLSNRDFYDLKQDILFEADLASVRDYLTLSEAKHRAKIEQCLLPDGSLRIRRLGQASSQLFSKLELWQPAENAYGLPVGIESALKQLLPEVILIEAFVDAAAEAEGKGTATLAKLVKAILEPIREQAEASVGDSLSKAKSMLNLKLDDKGDVIEDPRAPVLKEIEETLSRRLAESFEGATARLHIDLPEFHVLLAGARVELHDGDKAGRWTPPRYKGQGLQRALYVALVRTLAQRLRSAEAALARPFILMIEEPEAFLHPSARSMLRGALETISQADQVLYATHSPSMVSPQRIPATILIRKDNGVTRRLKPIGPELDASEKRIRHVFEYGRSAAFLFADQVVVVEGPSDVELLDAMYYRETNGTLESRGMACIDADNKTVVKECMGIVTNIGLPAYGLVDVDFLWHGAGKLIAIEEKTYTRFCEDLLKTSRAVGLIGADDSLDKLKDKKKVAELLEADFRDQRDTFIKRLRDTHGIWVWSSGEIENYVSMSGQATAKGRHAAAAREVRSGAREVQHKEEVQQLFRWLGVL